MFYLLLGRRELFLKPIVVANELLQFVDVLGEVPANRLIDPSAVFTLRVDFFPDQREILWACRLVYLGGRPGTTTITLVEPDDWLRSCTLLRHAVIDDPDGIKG